jgi:hypothetical protein
VFTSQYSRLYSPSSEAHQDGISRQAVSDASVASGPSKLWNYLRSKKANFKASDGSLIQLSIDELLDHALARKENAPVVLELPQGVAWLHKDITTESSRFLFLRRAAFDIAGLIIAHYTKERAGIVVVGTPGIGKSWLSNLLLSWAAFRGINVIFENVKDDVVYIFEAGKDTVVKMGPPARRPWPFADERKTLYVMDAGGKGVAREPLGINAFTVCLASPNEKHYGQFAKSPGVRKLMMPPWSWHEIEAIAGFATASLPDVPTEEVLKTLEQRFYEVGGILRTLFLPPDDYNNKLSAMKESLKKLTQDQIDVISLKDQEWQKVPNDLFVLKPSPPAYDWLSCSVDLSSEYLRRVLPDALDANKRRALLSALVATAPFKKEFGSYRGWLLENAVKSVLPQGGSFSIRNLADKKKEVDTITLPQQRLIPVWDVKTTDKITGGSYFLPTKSNQEHIDALFLLGDELCLLQKTVSTSREIPPLEDTQKKDGGISRGLLSLVSEIFAKTDLSKNPRLVRFIFVVDESAFQSFRLEKSPTLGYIHGIPLTVEVLKV